MNNRKLTVLDISFIALIAIGAILIIIPFWNVFVVSFATQKEYADHPLMLIPTNPTLENYKHLLSDGKILTGYKNTIILIILGVPLSIFLTSSMAYGFSYKSFPGKKILLFAVMFTMIFNGGIVPMYLVMKGLNLTGTLWSVVFANCFSVYNMILMMNYFQTIPVSLMESARLDGLGDWGILMKIVLPLSKPIFATITLFYLVAFWNQWYDSMIFLRKADMMPLQNVLRSIIQETQLAASASGSLASQGDPQFSEGIKMAAVFISMLPIMCIFPLLQKHFTKGIMVGAVKS